MTTPTPKIDLRTYADLVADTEWLAQGFTGYGFLILKSPIWEPSKENLASFTIGLSTLRSADDLPSNEKSLVFVGKIGGFYHLRIFDVDKQKIIDAGREEFSPNDSLRKLIEKCFNLQAKNQSIDEADKRNLLSQLAFPKEGKGLVVVGKDKDSYRIRILDWTGKQIVDVDKDQFKPDETLLQQLEDAFNRQSNNQLDNQSKSKLLRQIQISLDLPPSQNPSPQWIPSIEGKPDAGGALIRIFGRMVSLVSDRLNRVPDKHFLTFLELIGTQIQPPHPARVPLSFSLVEQGDASRLETLVPVGTQIAAATSDSQGEVVFETDQDLVVTSAQLQAVYVRQPNVATTSSTSAFTGEASDRFLLIDLEAELINRVKVNWLTLTFDTSQSTELFNCLGEWSYWNGTAWTIIRDPAPEPTLIANQNPSQVQVRIKPLSDLQRKTELGKTCCLRVKPKPEQQSINLTINRIQATVQVEVDKYSDNTALALGKQTGSYSAFAGKTPIDHYLYLALDDRLVALPGSKTLTLTLKTAQPNDLSQLLGQWTYWDGTAWEKLSSSVSSAANSLTVTITALPNLQQIPVNQKTAAWLRVELKPNQPNPSITSIQTKVEASTLDLLPDRCLLNTTALDLSKDFFPFGEHPQFNDTFYLAHARVFAIPGATVTLKIELTQPPNSEIPLVWEGWNGQEWVALNPQPTGSPDTAQKWMVGGTITLTLPTKFAATAVNSESNFWIRVRVNQLNYGKNLPTTPAARIVSLRETMSSQTELKVTDVRGFLVSDKIQIFDSTKAEPAAIKEITPASNMITVEQNLTKLYPSGASVILMSGTSLPVPTVLIAPLVKTLKISGYNTGDRPLATCLTINDFQIDDYTTPPQDGFRPFKPTQDTHPTLYLGFNQPFPNRTIGLYVQVAPPLASEIAPSAPNGKSIAQPPRLVWDYSATDPASGTQTQWQRLAVEDGTGSFNQRGLIRFMGPADFQTRQEFGQSLYWLRVRWENFADSQFRITPRLQRWLTNTIWATQATTWRNEILGSSDGNPNQRFFAAQVPILLGQRLEVQETALSPAELAALEAADPDAVKILRDEIGRTTAIWIHWTEVSDFYSSGPQDRHYLLDRLRGEIQFGDGKQGKIPPLGRQNVQLAYYRSGGGKRGNQPAQTVNQLKTTIPYVDRVSNLEAAAGGIDQESLEQLRERGPKSLRHQGKAVTMQDFEDLAYAASTEVARVMAIVPTALAIHPDWDPLDQKLWFDPKKVFDPADPAKAAVSNADWQARQELVNQVENQVGQVQVIIVPHSPLAQPIPSLALVELVESDLRSRCTPTTQVQVVGPDWVQVSVTATVVPATLDAGDRVRQAVLQRLEQFLHPLTGGKTGQGWPFGRTPHESDLYAVIEAIDQVAYVKSLTLISDPLEGKQSDHFLVYSGSHSITLA